MQAFSELVNKKEMLNFAINLKCKEKCAIEILRILVIFARRCYIACQLKVNIINPKWKQFSGY